MWPRWVGSVRLDWMLWGCVDPNELPKIHQKWLNQWSLCPFILRHTRFRIVVTSWHHKFSRRLWFNGKPVLLPWWRNRFCSFLPKAICPGPPGHHEIKTWEFQFPGDFFPGASAAAAEAAVLNLYKPGHLGEHLLQSSPRLGLCRLGGTGWRAHWKGTSTLCKLNKWDLKVIHFKRKPISQSYRAYILGL